MKIVTKTGIFNHSMLMIMAIGFLLSGCTAATERLHPRFAGYRQTMGVMLVLIPEIGIVEQLADGSRMLLEDRSRDARQMAQDAIITQLQDRRFVVRTVDADTMSTGELTSIRPLFRSVNRSIQLHTIGPQVFSPKKASFEYHLGSVADILDAYGADGLVLAIGHQTGTDIPTGNWLSIAVVEPGGRIIWYGIYGNHEQFNIQTTEGMQALVASTMAGFWEQGL